MKKILSSVFVILSMIVLTNCASITGPGRQSVKITSSPSGADVFVDGRTVTTPAIVDLKGKSQYYVKAEKDGYRDTSNVIGSSVRILPAVVGNIFNFTGLVGMAIDFFGTGAAYDLDNEVNIKLKKDR